MLIELHIQNFAIIEDLTLRFAPGLNVLTGETGAGKSIVIDAIGAVLGQKMGPECIRSGAPSARVEATFEVDAPNPVWTVLEEMGIPPEEEEVLLSREILPGGRSRCRINGRAATVSMLRNVGIYLVDIHGQHEHQSLLRVDHHLAVLDNTGGRKLQEARQTVREQYGRLLQLRQQLESWQMDEREKARRIDLLTFQAQEIAAAQLQPGEDSQLREERVRLANAERLAAAAGIAYAALYEGLEEGQRSALDLLSEAQIQVEEIARLDARMDPLREALEGAIYALQDVAHELAAYRNRLEFNPARLDEIEARLASIENLSRKYGPTISDILDYGRAVEEELRQITHSEERRQQLQAQIADLEVELGQAAQRLSEMRRLAAQQLQRQVVQHLQDLRMERVGFEVSLDRTPSPSGVPVDGQRYAVTADGIDQVEFLISTNPGEPLKPLAKIASGGEISRIMLALKSVVADVDQIPTLIFDEIDVGIGGATARAVGEKLARVAHSRQVLCVTHWPQIASLAQAHFRIVKRPFQKRIRVEVARLEEEERVVEIGRMLGGDPSSPTTLEHARELMRQGALEPSGGGIVANHAAEE